MKLRTNTHFEETKYIEPEAAVTYVCEREARRCESGELERMQRRYDALENIVGQLLGAMIANGQLRKEQVDAILSYDIEAE